MKIRVTRRGQLTLPKKLRERLGLAPGALLELHEERERMILVKSDGADPVSEVYGCLGKRIDTDTVIAQLRGRSGLR